LKLFDHLNNLTVNKVEYDSDNDEQVKTYQPYMINRFISMSELYLPIVNQINKCHNLPKEAHYTYFNTTLPKRRQYFKYVKKKVEISEEDRNLLCKYYKVGPRQVDEYINILTPEQIKIVVNKYKKNGLR
jgi:hypothetical protein